MPNAAQLLAHLMEQRATDLHIKAGSVPYLRVNGRLVASSLPVMNAHETETLVGEILPPDRAEEFRLQGETDFALSVSGVGRFRVSVMRQRGSAGLAFRRVVTTPPTFEALGIPPAVQGLAESRQGLVLVTGPADSGKSTTIAAMINHINEHANANIITIEDPIEMLHADKKAFISQREIGTDSVDAQSALQRSLRHDPDVIYLDRMDESLEMVSTVLNAATARLIITTTAGVSSADALTRIIDLYPPHKTRQARQLVASVLQGIICERLVEREDGKGRVAAFEFLITTPRIHDSILETPGSQDLELLIETGDYYGMQTLDQHLAHLHASNVIGLRDALAAAVHPQELRAKLTGPGSGASG